MSIVTSSGCSSSATTALWSVSCGVLRVTVSPKKEPPAPSKSHGAPTAEP